MEPSQNNRFDLTTRPVTQSAKYVMQIARQSRVAGQAYVLRTRLRAPGFTLIYARAILGAGIPSMWNVGLYYKKHILKVWK